jgi:AcrR family transcriptional regulator
MLRAEIMAAAEERLLKTGSVEAVSIRTVADAVGVTPPSIYRHFPDKDTLIAEVCARHFATLEAELDAAVDEHDDPVERLAACGKAYVRFGVANPEPYRILFMTRLTGVPESRQMSWLSESTVFDKVVGHAQACIDAGLIRPEHTDAFRMALQVWALAHGLTALAVIKPFLDELSTEEFIDDYVDTGVRSFAL